MRLAMILLLATSLHAAPRSRRSWVVSVAVLVAANLVDSHSSWGSMETNPLMRSRNGTFGRRGLAIKNGAVAGLVTVEYLLIRRRPGIASGFTAGNFSAAAFLGSVAVRNYRVTR